MIMPIRNLESEKLVVMLLGPSLDAVSGVSTHLNQLFGSVLSKQFKLLHFQVGSEGRSETIIEKLGRFIWSPVQFFLRLIRYKPQIVHLNTSMDPKSFWRDLVYFFIAHAMGKKIVYQVHGGQLPQDFFRPSGILSNLLKQTLLRADVVIVLTQEELRSYKEFSPKARLELIANAIEIGADAVWKRTSSTLRRPLRLIYLGRLDECKGIFELIEGLEIARRECPDIVLTIAGSGSGENRLRALVDRLGLAASVHFLGVVIGEEKKRAWEDADLFVFPTYAEGLPYALLESMAARTPPLVSAVGAISDVIEDGLHGSFITLRNPRALAEILIRLDGDRDLICRMGEACRQRIVSNYSIERLERDFSRLYRSVLT
jgi:glycosyltransferase involved in cell wall biosynthesis